MGFKDFAKAITGQGMPDSEEVASAPPRDPHKEEQNRHESNPQMNIPGAKDFEKGLRKSLGDD